MGIPFVPIGLLATSARSALKATDAFATQGTSDTDLGHNTAQDIANFVTTSVMLFGAVGDGMTDNAAAFAAAVAAVSAAGGGVIYYPPGTWLTSASIPDVANVAHRGAGVEATKVVTNANVPVFLRAGSGTRVINGGGIRDMTIHGSWGSNPSNTLSYGISCSGSNGATYENLRLEGCYVGFYAQYNYESYVTNVHVIGAGTDQNYDGFLLDYTGLGSGQNNNAFYWVNCVAESPTNVGWVIRNGNGSNFINCSAEGCGSYGFLIGFSSVGVLNPQFMQFSNCTGDSCGSSNWLIQGTSALPAQYMLFANCWSGLTAAHNWAFINCRNITFTGCNGISAAQNAIFLDTGDSINITGFVGANYNTSLGGFAGIDIASSNNNLIVGNTLTTTNTSGGTQSIAENGTSNYNVVESNLMPNGGQVLGSNSSFRNNQSFVTEAAGTATVASSSTSVVVTHGLAVVPNAGEITLTPESNFTAWVTSIGGTTFTLNVSSSSGVTCGWRAAITRH